MNTSFKCLLFALNLLIIFNTEDILDVILNCIALEFVAGIDEGFVSSAWWDDRKRWLKAGAMELKIRAELEIDILGDFKMIWQNYLLDYYGPRDTTKKGRGAGRYPRLTPLFNKCDELSHGQVSCRGVNTHHHRLL